MNQNRRRILSATASLGVASALPRLTWAQVVTPAWPAKPIRVIVGFPPGGLTDILARAYSEPLSQQLGRPVIVENKPGAASMIAAAEVARAAPDGYTFLFTISGTINQNRVLYKKMSYDPDKDFAYVSGIDAGHLPLAVSSSTKITTMREFVSRDLDLWAYAHDVTLDFSRPGKPTDNAFIESFNGKLRAECLNAHWFMCLADASEKCEAWRRDYNEVRPHSAIGNKPPVTLIERSAAQGPR